MNEPPNRALVEFRNHFFIGNQDASFLLKFCQQYVKCYNFKSVALKLALFCCQHKLSFDVRFFFYILGYKPVSKLPLSILFYAFCIMPIVIENKDPGILALKPSFL